MAFCKYIHRAFLKEAIDGFSLMEVGKEFHSVAPAKDMLAFVRSIRGRVGFRPLLEFSYLVCESSNRVHIYEGATLLVILYISMHLLY